jgi:hypothetical protein
MSKRTIGTKKTANEIIAQAYGVPLSRVDDETVVHELVNLRRKFKKENLDDHQERLYYTLQTHGMI